jgi:hydrogenase expression/formation protein HypD
MLDILKQSSNPEVCRELARAVKEIARNFHRIKGRKPAFMEVCGSHTMALARSGVKQALAEEVRLISGPGCPVCVTDQKSIDAMIALAEVGDRIVCTFGDMMRVPGSKQTLMSARTAGKDIRILYSPLEAIKIAEAQPDKQVIFLGVGFETTIPILSLLIREASLKGLENFSLWMTTKLVEPILRYLLELGELQLDGFLLPGHVSIVLGADSYGYLSKDYNVSGVITGFEPAEMLSGIYNIISLAISGEAKILNDHRAVVTPQGNIVARQWMDKYFAFCDEAWRGIGTIPNSGLDLKDEFEKYNAKKRFKVSTEEPRKTKCRCGEIIRGLISPDECSLFGKACKPLNPVGPCMVSAEGSCAAAYHFMRER